MHFLQCRYSRLQTWIAFTVVIFSPFLGLRAIQRLHLNFNCSNNLAPKCSYTKYFWVYYYNILFYSNRAMQCKRSLRDPQLSGGEAVHTSELYGWEVMREKKKAIQFLSSYLKGSKFKNLTWGIHGEFSQQVLETSDLLKHTLSN